MTQEGWERERSSQTGDPFSSHFTHLAGPNLTANQMQSSHTPPCERVRPELGSGPVSVVSLAAVPALVAEALPAPQSVAAVAIHPIMYI